MEKNSDLLLGSKVVLNMLSVVENPHSYTVFFDNLFTDYPLLVHLGPSKIATDVRFDRKEHFCRSVINNGGARTKTVKANQEHTATSAM